MMVSSSEAAGGNIESGHGSEAEVEALRSSSSCTAALVQTQVRDAYSNRRGWKRINRDQETRRERRHRANIHSHTDIGKQIGCCISVVLLVTLRCCLVYVQRKRNQAERRPIAERVTDAMTLQKEAGDFACQA